MTENKIRREIVELERQRCAALMSADIATLDALVSEDLVHIHGNGDIDGKAEYLKGVTAKYTFHSVERGELKIRQYGDIIVVNGSLDQTVSVNGIDKLNKIKAMVTQTWVNTADGWKQNTCHMGFLSIN